MKSFAAISLAALASALPAPQAGTTTPLRFSGLALRSASPIHFGSINANDLSFYIGRNTSTYCPTDSAASSACATANTNTTIFSHLNGASTIGLSTEVPGGQQVYVSESIGQLKFTEAHSAATDGTPIYEGFAIVYDAKLQFEGDDWLACENGDGSYGIYAASRSEGGDNCLGFTWRNSYVQDDTAPAWQYTK